MIAWPSNTIPAGWLLCDGSAFSAALYPALAAVIGTTYGGTAANPNTPNLMGRVPAGKYAGYADFDALGKYPGEFARYITVGQLPPHSHNLSMFDGDQHDYLAGGAEGYGIAPAYDAARALAGTISNTGGGQALPIVQPSTIVNFIIKAVPGVDSVPAAQDTGWLPITSFEAGYTGYAVPHVPYCRVLNGVAYFKGAISGNFPAATTVPIATAPSAVNYSVDDSRGSKAISDWTGYTTYGNILGGGQIRVFYPTAVTRTINLAGFSGYPVGA